MSIAARSDLRVITTRKSRQVVADDAKHTNTTPRIYLQHSTNLYSPIQGSWGFTSISAAIVFVLPLSILRTCHLVPQ